MPAEKTGGPRHQYSLHERRELRIAEGDEPAIDTSERAYRRLGGELLHGLDLTFKTLPAGVRGVSITSSFRNSSAFISGSVIPFAGSPKHRPCLLAECASE